MGTWLSTVRFPDGSEKYARYSTVVGVMSNPLFRAKCPLGGTLPDGSHCYRATVVGDPEPIFPERPLAPIDDLVLVAVDHDPDRQVWHALYCPNRAMVLGPFSGFYAYQLPQTFELVRDEGGVRHLCRGLGTRSECGREVDGEPLGLYQATGNPWAPPTVPAGPEPTCDLFAEWNEPDLCRPCLLRLLTRPDDAPAPVPAGSPRPAGRGPAEWLRSWWHAR